MHHILMHPLAITDSFHPLQELNLHPLHPNFNKDSSVEEEQVEEVVVVKIVVEEVDVDTVDGVIPLNSNNKIIFAGLMVSETIQVDNVVIHIMDISGQQLRKIPWDLHIWRMHLPNLQWEDIITDGVG